MAKFEVNSFLGSSQDNFLVFATNDYDRPFVTFYVKNDGNPVSKITIKDALDDDGYNKELTYSPSEIVSDSSFRTFPGNKNSTIFSLLECLKKNQIFYDITMIQNIPNVGIMIKAYIDSTTKYNINGGSYITVGGSYSSYTPKEPNKYVVLENISGDTQITLEKFQYNGDVSFNVTAPFEHLSFYEPFQLNMVAYRLDANNIIPEAIGNNNVTVLPTTLSKFQDINLSDYYYNTSGVKVNFLTNLFERDYNYGEQCALSVLTSKTNLTLKKVYYAPSGKYLGEDTTTLYKEHPFNRQDFYFELNISGIENTTNKQVGYVIVSAFDGSTEATNSIRYNVIPKCNQNNEIFFVNEVGGIDSFNFLGERELNISIDDQITYFRNPTRRWDKIKEIEVVSQKKNEVKHTLKTTIIDVNTAKWLNELNKTKYAFLFVNGNPTKFKKIVINELDIDISDRENTFEVELEYQDSDNNISI